MSRPAGGGHVAGARTDRGARGAAAVDGGERERGELGGGLRARGGVGAERARHSSERAAGRPGAGARWGAAIWRGPPEPSRDTVEGRSLSPGGAPVSSSTSVQPSE